MVQELKVAPKYLYNLLSGLKSFEVRFNDRNYQVGDILALREFDNSHEGDPFGPIDRVEFEVTYILDDPEYVKEGYVIMSIVPRDRMFCEKLQAEWDILHDEVKNG